MVMRSMASMRAVGRGLHGLTMAGRVSASSAVGVGAGAAVGVAQRTIRPVVGTVTVLSPHRWATGNTTAVNNTRAERDAVVPEAELTATDKFIRRLGWLGGFYSKRQVVMRSARKVYLTVCSQSQRPELYQITGLPDTFQSWFLVQQLHIWMLLVRSKTEGSDGKHFHKQLVQFFWQDVEHRMTLMRVEDVTIKSESNRELNSMFYGLLFAYDEGLAKDDQVLAAAVWRNLFHASKATATLHDVTLVVEYIRRELAALEKFESDTMLKTGSIQFGPPPSPREAQA